MEKTGNVKQGKTPCVKCGCNSAEIINGDPLCSDCARECGTKQASACECAGSCKTVNNLTDKHKE